MPLLILLAQTNNNITNKMNLANQFQRSGNFEKAAEIYQELYNVQPWNNNVLIQYNNVLIQLKRYDEAIEILNKRLEQKPTDLSTYGMLGTTYYTKGDHKVAEDVWRKGISTKPEAETVYRVISRYAVQTRAFDLAIEFLKTGQSMSSNPQTYSYELANLYQATMNFGSATKEYCRILVTNPQQVSSIKKNISRYLETHGALDASIDAVEQFLSDQKNNVITELLAFLYSYKGENEKAFSLIVELDKATQDNGVLIFNFAEKSFKNKEYLPANIGYKFILENYPDSPFLTSTKIGYAKSLDLIVTTETEKLNDWKPISYLDTTGSYVYRKVIKEYIPFTKNSLQNKYYTEVCHRVGFIYRYNLGDEDRAQLFFNKVFEYSPNSKFGYLSKLELISMEIEKGNLDNCESYYNAISNSGGIPQELKSESKFKHAKVAFWKNDFEMAAKLLNDISTNLKDNSANNSIEFAMVLTMLKNDSLGLADLAEADFLITQKKYEKAAQKFSKISENTNMILSEIAKFRYAEVLTALNQYEKAQNVLSEIIEKSTFPVYSDKAVFFSAEIYFNGLADYESAQKGYEKILESFPNSIYFSRSREMINLILMEKSDNI